VVAPRVFSEAWGPRGAVPMLAYPGLDPEGAALHAKKARARRRSKMTAKRRRAAARCAALELPRDGTGLLRRCSSGRSPSSASLLSEAERLRAERKVRNRLSAAASRKRKQDKVKSLESRVLELEKENTELRARMLLMERIAATGAEATTQILPGNHVDKHASFANEWYSLLETQVSGSRSCVGVAA